MIIIQLIIIIIKFIVMIEIHFRFILKIMGGFQMVRALVL